MKEWVSLLKLHQKKGKSKIKRLNSVYVENMEEIQKV